MMSLCLALHYRTAARCGHVTFENDLGLRVSHAATESSRTTSIMPPSQIHMPFAASSLLISINSACAPLAAGL